MSNMQVELLIKRIAEKVAEQTVGACFPEVAERWWNRHDAVFEAGMEAWGEVDPTIFEY